MSPAPDFGKTLFHVQRARRGIVLRNLQRDRARIAGSRDRAYRAQECATDPGSPLLGHYAEGEQLAFAAEVEGQGEPGRPLFLPG